jgi:hypothetical protein
MPKSRIFRRAGCGQEDVLRLEIAMDQPARVRGHEAVRRRRCGARLLGATASGDRRSQGFAIEQFRDQVGRLFDIPTSNT